MKTIKLKEFELPAVVQSPMANCTDLPFRLIARRQGMRFAFLEMVAAHTLIRENPKTIARMFTNEEDSPVGVQLVGCEPGVMAEAAAMVESMGYPLVDMNLGCPVPKVVAKGSGSELLRTPDRASKIFKAVAKAVKKIPATVKMRLGYEDPSAAEAIRIAQEAEAAGIDAIAVHGRTRTQGYSGQADYEGLRKVKEAVNIPVIGNGDVVDAKSALRMLEVAGCDGVMLGRGALGNPWIYREIEAAMDGEPIPPKPTMEEKKRVVLEHIRLQEEHRDVPIGPLRRIVCWYYKEVPGAPKFRDKAHHAADVAEMRRLVEENFR